MLNSTSISPNTKSEEISDYTHPFWQDSQDPNEAGFMKTKRDKTTISIADDEIRELWYKNLYGEINLDDSDYKTLIWRN